MHVKIIRSSLPHRDLHSNTQRAGFPHLSSWFRAKSEVELPGNWFDDDGPRRAGRGIREHLRSTGQHALDA
jgi:hypothetical protein